MKSLWIWIASFIAFPSVETALAAGPADALVTFYSVGWQPGIKEDREY